MPGYDFQGVRYPFDEFEHGVGTQDAYVDVKLSQVPSGHIRCYTRVVFQDEDNNATRINVYIGGYGELRLMGQDPSPDGDECYVISDPIYVPENRWLVVRFVGATSSDDLVVYAQGFDLIQPEGTKHA